MIRFDPELSRNQSKRENMVNYMVLIIRKRIEWMDIASMLAAVRPLR